MKRKRSLILLALILFSLPAAGETLDEYFTCRFSRSPAVYTGPADTYFRAGSGKAQYGSPGKARVYGEENGWLLIGYQTSSGQYRLGYIDAALSLDKMYEAPEDVFLRPLAFDYAPVWLTRDCELTDDPVISGAPIDSLKTGQECVFLASMNRKWAYIELQTGSEWKRGFVPLNAIGGWETEQPQEPAWEKDPLWLPDGPVSLEEIIIQEETVIPEETPLPLPTLQPTAILWSGSAPYDVFSGVWAIANQRLTTRSGPSALYPSSGTYYLQAKPVLVLAKHYDQDTASWWVKCRVEADDGTALTAWTSVRRFYNQDWLLGQLPEE